MTLPPIVPRLVVLRPTGRHTFGDPCRRPSARANACGLTRALADGPAAYCSQARCLATNRSAYLRRPVSPAIRQCKRRGLTRALTDDLAAYCSQARCLATNRPAYLRRPVSPAIRQRKRQWPDARSPRGSVRIERGEGVQSPLT